ncbi:helix-turn-helix transcriptional regulator [Acrocarpospora catenulata]|uniref:helix-turn-helix transcriptional regulator n=1 Tax=Acrocarpospora catenulata TaxID=2836182 RepID=UPI001BDB682D|nr:WYL domain-containing protein [Acrocarpospora catenulata]
MYEIGTEVRYHGSIESMRGEIFTVVEHCCSGTRHRIDGSRLLHHVRHQSITPVAEADPVAELERAVSDQKPVMITYVAVDGEWTTRVIEPHAVTWTPRGRAVVRAYDRLRADLRTFRVDRIQSLTVLPDAFRFDPAQKSEDRALARIRAEIAQVADHGYIDSARWTPDQIAL